MNCHFQPDPANHKKVRCVRCARPMHVVPGLALSQYHAQCGGEPSLGRKAINRAKAEYRDVKAGRPRRTEAEVEAILAICKANQCGLYQAKKGICTHKDCGCPVKRKAPYKMEQCPAGFWS